MHSMHEALGSITTATKMKRRKKKERKKRMIEKMKKRRITSEIMTIMTEKTLFGGRICVDSKLDSGETEAVEFS